MRRSIRSSLLVLLATACNVDLANSPQPATPSRNLQATFEVVPDPCTACVFGPQTFERGHGAPVTESFTLSLVSGNYFVDLDDLGSQGADALVLLNGEILMPQRGTSDIGPRHFQYSMDLAGPSTVEVRVVGKPGSYLRVAIWRPSQVLVARWTVPPGLQVQLEGAGVYLPLLIDNFGPTDLSPVEVQVWVKQGAARRSAGNQLVNCWVPFGVLPAGISCAVSLNTLYASNAAAGNGTLTLGSASLLIEVRLQTATTPVILDSFEAPIELIAPSFVVSVDVLPDRLLVPIGGTAQLTADVQVVGNPLMDVMWLSFDDAIATVNGTGLVTGTGSGSVTVRALAMIDGTKYDDAALYIYNPLVPPPFSFSMNGPTSPATVHRDAGANLTVTLSALAVGPSIIFQPFPGPVEFWARTPGGQWKLLGLATSTVMQDNLVNRTFTYSMTWDPSAATAPFADPSTTPIEIVAFGLRAGGIPAVTVPNSQVTVVVP